MTESELKKLNSTIRNLSYISGLIIDALHVEKNELIEACLETAHTRLEKVIDDLMNGAPENEFIRINRIDSSS